jgi:dimethylglycine dehydrogenase
VESAVVEHVRALVIGGGAVGVSALYHLARFGWKDCLLLEQNELTSGSTWHAAGNCPTFSTSFAAMKLQKYSVELYRELAADPAYPINYHVVGSVRLAHTQARMDEYAHVRAMARMIGLDYEILSAREMRQKHPFAETHDLQGALWDPLDGDIDPAQLTQALASRARELGATIRRFTKVMALSQQTDGRWRATTDKGETILADVVVNAAGYRAGEVMALVGRKLPIMSMSHQYLVTEDAQELEHTRLPLLRDPDVSYYLRQERAGFILGPYEWKATPMWEEAPPEDYAFKLGDDDLDRLEPYIEDAMKRAPLLARLGVKRVVNGPIPYSPDGNPYIGPERGLRNFFHANTFSFGITQAGGAGKALAEWVIHGEPEFDLWGFDRRRYGAYADFAYTRAKAIEVYQNEYAPAFPFEERPAGRPRKTSPLYETLKAKGARFGARGGWERAVCFDAKGEAPSLSFRRPRSFDPLVAAEVKAVRERAGVVDMPGFGTYEISGPGAAAALDRLVCSRLPREGRITLAYALTPKGGVLSEFTIYRAAADRFVLFGAASAEDHDLDAIEAALDADATLLNRTETLGTLVLAGPRARDVLAPLTKADLSNAGFPWLSGKPIVVAGREALALRVNYVGELGWELHAAPADLAAIYAAICESGAAHGLADFGLYAMDAMRLEKGYRGWKSDLEIGFSPLSASLQRFVDLTKPAFVGREALVAEQAAGPAWAFAPLTLDEAGDADAPALAPVYAGREQVGLVTSGGWGPTVGASIALAYLRPAFEKPGTKLEIEIFGERRAATVRQAPIYDPQNVRLRL